MKGYTGLMENSVNNLERNKAQGKYTNMRGCILEVNPEESGW